MGMAYHGAYLVWFELGRTEWMRESGCEYRRLEDEEHIFFPVVEASARFLSPARYDDLLEIRTRLIALSGVRARFEYSLRRPSDDRVLATGFTEHASIGSDGRPRRLPPELRERLQRGLVKR